MRASRAGFTTLRMSSAAGRGFDAGSSAFVRAVTSAGRGGGGVGVGGSASVEAGERQIESDGTPSTA
jgi:hypothetical protein